MQFLEKEICQITEGVWNDLLGMGVNRIAEAGPQNGGGKTLTGGQDRNQGEAHGKYSGSGEADWAGGGAAILPRPRTTRDPIG